MGGILMVFHFLLLIAVAVGNDIVGYFFHCRIITTQALPYSRCKGALKIFSTISFPKIPLQFLPGITKRWRTSISFYGTTCSCSLNTKQPH